MADELTEFPVSYDTPAPAVPPMAGPAKFSDIVSDPDYQRLPSEDQYKVRRGYYQKVLVRDPEYQKLSSDDRMKVSKGVLFPEAKAQESVIGQIKSGEIAAGPVGAALESVGKGIRNTPAAVVGMAKDIGKAAITPPEEGFLTPVSPMTSLKRLRDVGQGALSGVTAGIYQPPAADTEAQAARRSGGQLGGFALPFTAATKGAQALGAGKLASELIAGGITGAAPPLIHGDVGGAIEGATTGAAMILPFAALTRMGQAAFKRAYKRAPTSTAEIAEVSKEPAFVKELTQADDPGKLTPRQQAIADTFERGFAEKERQAAMDAQLRQSPQGGDLLARQLTEQEAAGKTTETQPLAAEAAQPANIDAIAQQMHPDPTVLDLNAPLPKSVVADIQKQASQQPQPAPTPAEPTIAEKPPVDRVTQEYLDKMKAKRDAEAVQRTADKEAFQKEVIAPIKVEEQIQAKLVEKPAALSVEGYQERYAKERLDQVKSALAKQDRGETLTPQEELALQVSTPWELKKDKYSEQAMMDRVKAILQKQAKGEELDYLDKYTLEEIDKSIKSKASRESSRRAAKVRTDDFKARNQELIDDAQRLYNDPNSTAFTKEAAAEKLREMGIEPEAEANAQIVSPGLTKAAAERLSAKEVVAKIESEQNPEFFDKNKITKQVEKGGETYVKVEVDPNELKVRKDVEPGVSVAEKGAIVVDDKGKVIDGNHRTVDAQEAGEKTIEAYVPVDSELAVKAAVNPIDEIQRLEGEVSRIWEGREKGADLLPAVLDEIKPIRAQIEELRKSGEQPGIAAKEPELFAGDKSPDLRDKSRAPVPGQAVENIERAQPAGDNSRSAGDNSPASNDVVRLYRGQTGKSEPISDNPPLSQLERGRWFTTDKDLAQFHGKDVHYVDVPKDVADASIVPDSLFNKSGRLLPAEWANKAQPEASDIAMTKKAVPDRPIPSKNLSPEEIAAAGEMRAALNPREAAKAKAAERVRQAREARGTNVDEAINTAEARQAAADQARAERLQRGAITIPEIKGVVDRDVNARDLTKATIREESGQMMRHRFQVEAALEQESKRWDSASIGDSLRFIDAIEKGAEQATPQNATLARGLRQILDERRSAIQSLGTGKLENFIQEYFPHIWSQPNEAGKVFGQIFGKRPLQGPASFLKKRTIPTTAEGIAAGLTPVTYNPVKLTMLKIAEMDRYLMAQKVKSKLETEGLAKYVSVFESPPDGWVKLTDRVFARYGKPTVTATSFESYDPMAEVAPTVKMKLEAFLNSHDETRPLLGLQKSLLAKRDTLSREIPVGGMVIRGNYFAPPEAAKVINNYLSPGLQGNPIYKAMRYSGNLLNQAQLGVSAFHLGFTSIDAITSDAALAIEQAARGNIGGSAKSIFRAATLSSPIENAITGNRLLKEYLEPGSYAKFSKEADALAKAGGRPFQDPFYKNMAIESFWKSWKEGDWAKVGLKTFPAALEYMSKPIMEYIVPRQKLGVFAKMATDILDRGSEQNWSETQHREAMQKAWDSVDNRMGQLVYDNLFWNKTVKDLGMVSVRSLGWNLGTKREVAGGVLDFAKAGVKLATGQSPELSHRMAYVMALPLVVGYFGAVYNYLATGEAPQDSRDYFFPRTGGTDTSGRPERVSLPTYMKDVYAYSKHPLTTLGHKVHPLLSGISEMLQNEDFYGTEIRHAGDPVLRQAEGVAKHVANLFTPFSIRNAQQRAKAAGEDSIAGAFKTEELGKTAQSFIGITPAPASVNKTDAEEMAQEFMSRRAPTGPRTRQEADQRDFSRSLEQRFRVGKAASADLLDAIKKGQVTERQAQNIYTDAKTPPLSRSVKHLRLDEALKVWDAADTKEREKIRPLVLAKVEGLPNYPEDQRKALMQQVLIAPGLLRPMNVGAEQRQVAR